MRTTLFQTYLKALHATLTEATPKDPALALFVETLANVLIADIDRTQSDAPRPSSRPLRSDPVLALALDHVPDSSALRAPLRAIAPLLDWYAVFHGPQAPRDLSDQLHMAPLTWQPHEGTNTGHHTGLFLLHPGVDYPAHTHLADEVYLCLSGQLTIKHGVDETPYHLTPGMTSITPPDRLHSLHTGDEPVILSYVWSGDLGAPNWWWHRDAAGVWMRERWQWEDNDDWRSYGVEPVTPEVMARCSP